MSMENREFFFQIRNLPGFNRVTPGLITCIIYIVLLAQGEQCYISINPLFSYIYS